jgi:hypothetical protein
MWKQIRPLLAALPFLATAQAADYPRLKAVEQVIEASSADVRLPDRVPATMFARSCAECPTRSLQLTQATQFFVGREAVTQAEFNRRAEQTTRMLGIFFDGKTSEVTRLVAFGATNAAGN